MTIKKRIMPMSGKPTERGVALITAVLITALASVIAITMVSQQQLDIRRTGNLLDGDRAYIFALGIEGWALHVLDRDKRDKDSLDEDWAKVLPAITVEGGQVAGFFEDMQGRFNINNLVKNGKQSQVDIERFNRLLESLEISVPITEAIVDWIDPDTDITFPDGAEDSEYMGRKTPYRTANTPMTSASELLLVKGVTAEMYNALAPFIVALPEYTEINVNTAKDKVLMAIVQGITEADAVALSDIRKETPFRTVDEFRQQPVLSGRTVQTLGINVLSSYFLLDANARFGDHGKTRLFSLFARKPAKIQVVMRGQGTY